jgi:hypothetical protein
MYKSTVAIVAVLALTGGSDAQFCTACKWGVNKVVTYFETYGNNAVCSAVLGEVQGITSDLCNSWDDCSQFVTNMCNDVLNELESDAGAALQSDGIDAASICADVGACSTGASDDDDGSRVRRTSQSWAENFCRTECANYPNPSECQPACVRQVTNGAQDFARAVDTKMRDDEQQSPTITLSTGETGHCVRDATSMHFLCSVDHPTTTLQSSPPKEKPSSSTSTGETVGIAIGAAAVVLLFVGIAIKARSEKKAAAAPTASVLLINEDDEYATA